MKKLILAFSFVIVLMPSISLAAGLTSQQATSLIGVVQSSPGTPASAFVSLITAFSNITTTQATDLIAVVQSSPSVPANAFINLLTSFTADTATTQNNSIADTSYPNSCNGVGSPSCPANYNFVCPSTGAGYCIQQSSSTNTCASEILVAKQKILDAEQNYYSGKSGAGQTVSQAETAYQQQIALLTAQEQQVELNCSVSH